MSKELIKTKIRRVAVPKCVREHLQRVLDLDDRSLKHNSLGRMIRENFRKRGWLRLFIAPWETRREKRRQRADDRARAEEKELYNKEG